MTIYDIAEATKKKAPYFFARDTLAFFNQTMGKFKVESVEPAIWKISCPMRDYRGSCVGKTIRFFYKDDLYNTLEQALAVKADDDKVQTFLNEHIDLVVVGDKH